MKWSIPYHLIAVSSDETQYYVVLIAASKEVKIQQTIRRKKQNHTLNGILRVLNNKSFNLGVIEDHSSSKSKSYESYQRIELNVFIPVNDCFVVFFFTSSCFLLLHAVSNCLTPRLAGGGVQTGIRDT